MYLVISSHQLIFKVVKMTNNKPNNHEMCLVQGKFKDSTET